LAPRSTVHLATPTHTSVTLQRMGSFHTRRHGDTRTPDTMPRRNVIRTATTVVQYCIRPPMVLYVLQTSSQNTLFYLAIIFSPQRLPHTSDLIFRPPVRSNGRSSVLPVMFFFFFRHAFSEFPRPIALKLCHLIGICVSFIMTVQN